MDSELKEFLLRQGRLHRMCNENLIALKACSSKKDAIELYKKTIDWALEENYPPLSVLRRSFSNCEEYGLYVDKEFRGEKLMDQQVYVLHHCSGTINVELNIEKKIIPMIYLANDCDITIKRPESSAFSIRVPIYSFGENIIRAKNTDNVEFRIYNFETK